LQAARGRGQAAHLHLQQARDPASLLRGLWHPGLRVRQDARRQRDGGSERPLPGRDGPGCGRTGPGERSGILTAGCNPGVAFQSTFHRKERPVARKTLSLLFACLCAISVSAHSAGVRPAAELIAHAVGEHRLVLLGEMHGTREIPLLTSMLVAHYARTEPVLLGLEVDASDQPLVDAFLESAGTDSDFAEVLSGAHWREPTHEDRKSTRLNSS